MASPRRQSHSSPTARFVDAVVMSHRSHGWLRALPAVALLSAGCSSSATAWRYTTPPTAAGRSASIQQPTDPRAIIVLEPFQNPDRMPIAWQDVGPGMSEALAQALLNRGEFAVRIERSLSGQVRQILDDQPYDHAASLREVDDQLVDQLSRERANRKALDELAENPSERVAAIDPAIEAEAQRLRGTPRYVILGQVTDFHHTGELPDGVGRRRWHGLSKKPEAIVAIHLQIVDLRTARVLLSDHIAGTARTGNSSTRKTYEDIAFGSYLFWNTPLGRASNATIDRCVARLDHHLPVASDRYAISAQPTPMHEYIALGETSSATAPAANAPARVGPSASGVIRIARPIDARRMLLSPVDAMRVHVGERYYLYEPAVYRSGMRAVHDPDTRQPLQVRILSIESSGVVAWLLGRAPRDIDLRGALLHPQPPRLAAPDELDDPTS